MTIFGQKLAIFCPNMVIISSIRTQKVHALLGEQKTEKIFDLKIRSQFWQLICKTEARHQANSSLQNVLLKNTKYFRNQVIS